VNDPSVLDYHLKDSAGGLWRRLWSLGYNLPLPENDETAGQWLDRCDDLRRVISKLRRQSSIL